MSSNRDGQNDDESASNDNRAMRGEPGHSESKGGRSGAPLDENRPPATEYDHGPYDDGNAESLNYGQGVYNRKPGQQGQESTTGDHAADESLGKTREPGETEDDTPSRGSDGGSARGDRRGNAGGDQYGGGGPNGGNRA